MSSDQRSSPIVGATEDLVAWMRDAAEVPVEAGSPGDVETGKPVVLAWPLELRPDQEARGAGQRPPMRLILRCLVFASGAPGEASRLLDRVLVAAAAAVDRVAVFEPPLPQMWQAFGIAPRPSLYFDVPLQIARSTPIAPLVRRPMQVQTMAMLALHGRVVGPGDVPLSDMRVELAATGHSAQTDSEGHFMLGGVPADEPARLRVRGRGQHLLAEVHTPSTDPVVIHINFEEG